jgi:hypothetical protein
MKSDIFRKYVEKIQVSFKSDKNNGYFNEEQYTFLIISRSALLRMTNVSGKICRENPNTHFMFFFSFENRAVCEIMWKNVVEPDWPQMTMAHARCILDT